MLVGAHRHIAADLIEHLLQPLLIDIVGSERQPRGDHAAADVDAHRRRDDGLVGGDDRADGGRRDSSIRSWGDTTSV